MSMAESGVDLTDVDPNTGAHKGHMMGDNWGKPNNDRRPSDDEVKDKWGHTVKRPPTPDSADKDDLPGGHAGRSYLPCVIVKHNCDLCILD